MELYIIVILNLFILSLIANVYLYRRSKNTVKKQITYDARLLMQDLTAGAAMVRITRIDPNSIFLKSPKDMG
jgi:hypothetical protein